MHIATSINRFFVQNRSGGFRQFWLASIALILLALVPQVALAQLTNIQYTTVSDGSGGVIITGFTVNESYPLTTGPLVIPDTINALPVTAIGANAFQSVRRNLTSVTVPNGVTSIGDLAFNGCYNLTSISLPNSLTSIGQSAFLYSGLTSITIPDSVISIGDVAFNGDNVLASVTIGNGLTSIGNYVFEGCVHMTSLTLGTGLTSIGVSAFQDCPSLTSVAIPAGVTSIADSAFQDCTGLAALTLPSGVTTLGVSTFQGCTGLTSLSIPSNITSISASAFSGCTGLTSLTLSSGITTVGNSAFSGCTSLPNVTLPGSITSIGQHAFTSCTSLTTATYLGNAPTMGASVFTGAADNFTVDYYAGATGFTAPTWTDSSSDVYPSVSIPTPASALNGTPAGTNLDYSPWFGYFTPDSFPLVYEFNLGYEYVFVTNGGIYLYDFTSGHFWYTQASYFPFVYDFTMQTYLYYYQGTSNPRYFSNMTTGQVMSSLAVPSITSASSTGVGPGSRTFAYQITATNNPTSYGVTGQLPGGLSLDTSTGLISGTTTYSGIYNVTISATNAIGTGSQNLMIEAPPIIIGGGG